MYVCYISIVKPCGSFGAANYLPIQGRNSFTLFNIVEASF